MVGRIALLVAAALSLTACTDRGEAARDGTELVTTVAGPATTSATTTTAPNPRPPAYTSEVYSDPDHWLCLPGRADDACDVDLTTTRIDMDGSRRVEAIAPDTEAPIDCFYVYPTVSAEPAANSGLTPTDAERRVVRVQAAHLQVACRLYAPMYRQITRAALLGQAEEIPDRGLAFGDVEDAWFHYLAHHNDGRGVVLIGHSQGAGHLRELLSRHIDKDPRARELLVSAVLLGTTVRTPADDNTGAHFDHLGPCESRDQLGCIISWSSYDVAEPPGDVGLFASVRGDTHERAICTHPRTLGPGAAPIDSIVPNDPGRDTGVSTPWVRYVGLAEAECVEAGSYHYLEVRFPSGTADGVPSHLGGGLGSAWGLHLIDVQVALGDLVDLVSRQARNHVATR